MAVGVTVSVAVVSISLRSSLGLSGPLAVVMAVGGGQTVQGTAMDGGHDRGVGDGVGVPVAVEGLSLSLGLGISGPLAIVAMSVSVSVSVAVSVSMSVGKSVAVTVVGIGLRGSLGSSLGISGPLAVEVSQVVTVAMSVPVAVAKSVSITVMAIGQSVAVSVVGISLRGGLGRNGGNHAQGSDSNRFHHYDSVQARGFS